MFHFPRHHAPQNRRGMFFDPRPNPPTRPANVFFDPRPTIARELMVDPHARGNNLGGLADFDFGDFASSLVSTAGNVFTAREQAAAAHDNAQASLILAQQRAAQSGSILPANTLPLLIAAGALVVLLVAMRRK